MISPQSKWFISNKKSCNKILESRRKDFYTTIQKEKNKLKKSLNYANLNFVQFNDTFFFFANSKQWLEFFEFVCT